MQDKIEDVFNDIKLGNLSLEMAQRRIIELFVDKGLITYHCQYCGAEKTNDTGMCVECGRFTVNQNNQ